MRVIEAKLSVVQILLKSQVAAGTMAQHVEMGDGLVPWVPFDTKLEIVVPYLCRNSGLHYRRCHVPVVLVHTYKAANCFGQDGWPI